MASGTIYIAPAVHTVVNCKLYTSFNANRFSAIYGNKANAADIDKGYIYVYQHTPGIIYNSYGYARNCRLFKFIKAGADNRITLPLTLSNKLCYYFFFYSQFELDEDRRKAIVIDLDRYISFNGGKKFCRGQYIPLINRELYTERKTNNDIAFTNSVMSNFLVTNNDYQDIEFSTDENEEFNATIYLHDWFGQLKKHADAYQEQLQNYYDFFNQTVTLSDFATHPSGEKQSTPDPSMVYDDTFTIKDLYPLTEMIDKLYQANGMKYGNDLRLFNGVPVDFTYESYTSGSVNTMESVASLESVPVYKLFLQMVEEKLNQIRHDLQPFIQPILYLFGNGRANSAFMDYLYSDDHNITLLLDTLGRSFECSFFTMYPDDRKKLVAILTSAYQEHEAVFEKVAYSNRIQLHDKAGDNYVLLYILQFYSINFYADESSWLLEMLVDYAESLPDTMQVVQYNILRKGVFKNLNIQTSFCKIDERRLLNFIKKYFPDDLKDGKNYSEFIRRWFEKTERHLTEKGIQCRLVETTNLGDSSRHWVVEVEQLDTVPDTRNLRTRLRINKADVFMRKLSVIIAGFNAVYQVSLMRDCDSLVYAIPSMASAAGSVVSIGSTLADSFGVKALGRNLGSLALLLSAGESGVLAYLANKENDNDSAFFHAGASLAYFGAASAVFLGAANPVIMGLVGLGFIFTYLADYFKDTAIDIFLKYSVWGFHYKEDWRYVDDSVTLPSWWPSNELSLSQIESDKTPIQIDSKIRKNQAYNLYSRSRSHEENIKANYALLNIVRQIPPYRLEFATNDILFDNVQHRYIALDLKAGDFENMKRIKIVLRRQINTNDKGPVYGNGLTRFVYAQRAGDAKYFFKNPNPDSKIISHSLVPIESAGELYFAENMRILFLPDREYGNVPGLPASLPFTVPDNAIIVGPMLKKARAILCELTIEYSIAEWRPVQFVKRWEPLA
jgi:hypothetical protein